MDESSKLALAVVAAAVILIGGYVGYNEYSRSRDMDQAQQALDQFRQSSQLAVDQARQSWQAGQQQQAVYVQQQQAYKRWLHERERLQPNQRCIGGVVVEVQGSTYTQLGYPGYPAHCADGYADQPTR